MMGPGMQRSGKVAEKFVLASVAWLAVGLVFATYFMVVYPVGVPLHLTFTHAHVMLIGFVGFLIFGVAYRMLPLPPLLGTGGLYSVRMAEQHFWIANVALVGMVVSALGMMVTDPALVAVSTYSGLGLRAFGLLQVLATFMFVYNIWRTVRMRESDLPFGGPAAGGSAEGPE